MKKKLLVFFALAVSLCAAVPDSASRSIEEELRQFGAEDLILTETKSAKSTKPVSDSVKTKTDPSKSGVKITDSGDSSGSDTVITEQRSASIPDSSAKADTVKSTVIAKDVFSTAVDTVSSVDMGGGVAGYRSPLKAMFFSLVIPGSGQIYARKPVKGAVSILLEAAAIAGIVKFKNDGNKMIADAHSFADAHFSTVRLESFYTDLTAYGRKIYEKYGDSTVNYLIFGPTAADSGRTAVQSYMDDFSESTQRYEKIQEPDAVQGWQDASPGWNSGASAINSFYKTSGTAWAPDSANVLRLSDKSAPFGTSSYQKSYIDQLNASTKKFSLSQAAVVALVINHVVSAADAFMSASRSNRKLMNQKSGIIGEISLKNDLYLNEFNEITTNVGIAWKF